MRWKLKRMAGGGLEWYKNFLWDNGNVEWVLWTTLLKLTKLAAPTGRQVDLGLIVHHIGQYLINSAIHTHTHKQPFNGPLSGTTRVSRYQKDNTNLDFTEARDSEWQWHQLGRMQVCTSLQTDNHASTPPLSFLQAGCPSCHPTNSVKALKAQTS